MNEAPKSDKEVLKALVDPPRAGVMEVDETQSDLPPQVKALAPRERQVAALIFRSGGLTAKEVVVLLGNEIKNASVRSMLVRLVKKGMIKRLWGGRGQHREYVYVPTVCPMDVKETALRMLAEQMFQGSLPDLARTLFVILDREMPARQGNDGTAMDRWPKIPVQLNPRHDSGSPNFGREAA